ncbi:hypothetical protein SAMN04489717_1888 [Actinopolymorpha singaporensis]|uniref:Uncharacterized protein n=1 Tax=Actinopolymorpha singaporensis TaxID=117157 RepID=A0A1H1Q517_9ACTN|nr:hypothetical protein SAMN04489717_1888 [Actinopolymorpha singaporensis]
MRSIVGLPVPVSTGAFTGTGTPERVSSKPFPTIRTVYVQFDGSRSGSSGARTSMANEPVALSVFTVADLLNSATFADRTITRVGEGVNVNDAEIGCPAVSRSLP